ncbi:Rrf2 family transcriptional regulator [Haladaptatus caseinilyticus]|uniref:Rrf2 family transcriptional regulator n=1 Tax=Haladaptatus caseinilyticus TaxID=2993314 RepID=UPI00224B3E05|nr:Rrf2 family transcriptional regulator [Haladaptatus caseinilyticus]
MSSIELTASQKKILTALVNLHGESESAVKGEEIADDIDRNPGTIRNQMQSLKALQLVEGVPGPKGGYKPTATAFNVLDIQTLDEAAEVPLVHNDEPVENATVNQISLSSVHHPERCRAEVHIQGSLSDFHTGDLIRVGPTPLSNLEIEGELESTDTTNNIVILKIQSMQASDNKSSH